MAMGLPFSRRKYSSQCAMSSPKISRFGYSASQWENGLSDAARAMASAVSNSASPAGSNVNGIFNPSSIDQDSSNMPI